MTVVDLHPEELLDKDARGELSTDERARLETHLARCAACRAERVLRLDFADELDGDDRPSALLELVQGALAAPRPAATLDKALVPDTLDAAVTETTRAPEPPEPMADVETLPGLRRRPRRTAFVLLVAAAVLAAGAAGATGMTGRVWSRLRGGSLEVTHASATSAPTSAPAGARGAQPSLGAAAPSPSLLADHVEQVEQAPEPVAVAAEPAPLVVAPAVAIVPAVAVAPSLAPAPAPVPTTASGLFEAANVARRSGDTVTALARYDALEAQFPGTREARAAKATTGKLLLDRGDSVGALSRFDAYLASGSSELREEAMAGRATALERLGRSDEESLAWSALIATYPGTPYGTHARSRISRSPRSLPR
jgi:anti-sigma factor RsiW